MYRIEVEIDRQLLTLYKNDLIHRQYPVSTAKNGVGEIINSGQTPRGKHIIRAKIGINAPENAVFVARRQSGEIYSPEMRVQFPDRDWILTRILWLSGLEPGKNRLGNVDTMRRYIYIHGTPDDVTLGLPGSKGCIRMRNSEIIELFDIVPTGTPLTIKS